MSGAAHSGRETSDVWRAFQGRHRGHFGKTLRKADDPDALGASEFAWNWSRAGEPAGLNQHDFIEDRLSRLVRQALERGRISPGRAAEVLGITREAMRKQAREWVSWMQDMPAPRDSRNTCPVRLLRSLEKKLTRSW